MKKVLKRRVMADFENNEWLARQCAYLEYKERGEKKGKAEKEFFIGTQAFQWLNFLNKDLDSFIFHCSIQEMMERDFQRYEPIIKKRFGVK